jgi:hypothetical protein
MGRVWDYYKSYFLVICKLFEPCLLGFWLGRSVFLILERDSLQSHTFAANDYQPLGIRAHEHH